MERSLLSIAALGAAVSAGVGAFAGAGLRVEPPPPRPWETPAVEIRPVSFEPAPAYPMWAPPPLYERAGDAGETLGAWIDRLTDLAAPAPRPAAFAPPADLPPPSEVRVTIAAPAPPPADVAPPQPIRVSSPPPETRAWIDREGRLYVEAPPPPAALSGPAIDRAQLFF